MEPKSLIMNFLCAGQLESAWDIMKKCDISIEDLGYHKAFKDLEKDLGLATVNGDIRAMNRLKRRIQSLTTFRRFGFVPQKLMPLVDLREGYHGKVLLVHIVGGRTKGLVCLRSGDDWHREILHNTRQEIQDLGFDKSQVTPMGGAWVQFDPEGTIQIYGSSDEFGACDKNVAAELIKGAFPDKKIYIRHS